MNIKKLFKVLCCVLLLLVIIYRSVELYSANQKNILYRTYTVSSGETLWSIARDQCPGEDPRKVVDIIRDKNGITPMIFPGQELMIPVVIE
jgi:hypothetical protein